VTACVWPEIARRKRACQSAQAQIPLFPLIVSTVVEEVCCNDQPVHSLYHDTLKAVLRILAKRCYGLGQGKCRRRPVSKASDAAQVDRGGGERWFSFR
jgi:hypothetical protein